MAVDVFYFDGHNGITDSNNAWTGDAIAFNGNTAGSSFAQGSGTGNPSGGALVGAGTNASGLGTVSSVRARVSGGNTTVRGFGSWVDLETPSGGWTSSKVENLETRIYNHLDGSTFTSRVRAAITTAGNAQTLGTAIAGYNSGNEAGGACVIIVQIEVTFETGERYLRASGNWNGPVWAATSGGAAGSASTPTANDFVYIAANFAVTLTADAECYQLSHSNGTLNLSSRKLSIGAEWGYNGLFSDGSTTRTLNLGSGEIEIIAPENGITFFRLSGTNLTVNSSTSTLTINAYSTDESWGESYLAAGDKVLNDVRINMGTSDGSPQSFNITGSPTFRSLMIESKNSAAHTVVIPGAGITVDKLIAIGSSSSNQLTLQAGDKEWGTHSNIRFTENGSSYGQFVATDFLQARKANDNNAAPDFPVYIGSNSIDVGNNSFDFIYQDPPKISTLVDPLTTAPGSNPNWTVTGTVSQVTTGYEGGGYSGGTLTSTDTLDLVGSEVVFEVRNTGTGFANMQLSSTLPGTGQAALPWLAVFSNSYDTGSTTVGLEGTFASFPHTNGYIKIGLSTGGVLSTRFSTDGATWSAAQTKSVDSDWLPHFRSNRISITSGNSGVIGSINPDMSPRVDVTYRFDGHNYITNTNDEWTNPSNAADGSLSTSANAYKAGGVMENVLILAGTVKESAPQVSDESIISVKARIYGSAQGASGDVGASIYDGANYLAAAMKNGTTAGWGPYVTLPVPSGGWTVSKLNNLSAQCFSMGGSDIPAHVYRVELLVTAHELPPLLSTGNFLPFFLGGD